MGNWWCNELEDFTEHNKQCRYFKPHSSPFGKTKRCINCIRYAIQKGSRTKVKNSESPTRGKNDE